MARSVVTIAEQSNSEEFDKRGERDGRHHAKPAAASAIVRPGDEIVDLCSWNKVWKMYHSVAKPALRSTARKTPWREPQLRSHMPKGLRRSKTVCPDVSYLPFTLVDTVRGEKQRALRQAMRSQVQ